MKKLLLLLLLTHSVMAGAQIKELLKKVKVEDLTKPIRITTEDVIDLGRDVTIGYLKDSRDSYDPTDFNYAVSFSDNSGMYESEEKYRRYEKGLLYALSPESLEDRTPEQKAEDYNDVGEVLFASGKYRPAELSFMGAYLIYLAEDLLYTKRGALVTSNLGLLFHTTGRLSKAEEYTRSALETRRDILNDMDGYGASLNNLAVLYKDLGKYTEAELLFGEAETITLDTKGRSSTAYAIVLNNKAILYQLLGKYEDAEEILLGAISTAGEKLKEKSANYIRMKVNLAMLYQLQGRYSEAEKIYLDAIDLKKRRLGTNHPDYAVLLRNLASLYQEQGKTEKAGSYLEEAVNIYKKKFGEDHHAYAAALFDLGKFRMGTNKTREALPLITKAIEIQRTQLGEHHPSLTDSREALAILKWMEKDWDGAAEEYKKVMDEYIYQVNTYFPAMSEYDKSRFWEKIYPKFQRYFDFGIEAMTNLPDISGTIYDYHLATKALLLNSTSKVKNRILGSGNTQLIAKYREWLDLKEYLARLYTLSREELQADKINLDSLEHIANSREKELSQASELFASAYEAKQYSHRDISAALAPDEACLEIIRVQKFRYLFPDTAVRYLALLLKPAGKELPGVFVFSDGNRMESEYARKYRTAMQRAFEGQSFRELYWRDLDRLSAGYPKIFVSLDGIYNQINLNTLMDASGKFLVDEKDIYLVTNTRDIVALKKRGFVKKPDRLNAVLVGNPDYAQGFEWSRMKTMPLSELPGTELEVKKINEQLLPLKWKTTLLLKQNASESRVRSVDQPALLHIATHGYFLADYRASAERVFGVEPLKAAENPLLRSGLLFTGADNTLQDIRTTGVHQGDDGVLNAYEVMIMNLDRTDLVVLSACETGLGEIVNGEGVYGLQRALQVAGASTVMISLWQVSDEVTQDLMVRFYKYWLGSGNKHQAFTRAQLEIKQKYPAPFYWGAFVMVNN